MPLTHLLRLFHLSCQFATENPPERTVLGTILAARHVAMYAFDVSTAIMLKSLIGNGQGKSYSRDVQPFYVNRCSLKRHYLSRVAVGNHRGSLVGKCHLHDVCLYPQPYL